MGVKRGIRPTPFNFLDVLDTNIPPEGKSIYPRIQEKNDPKTVPHL